ncbi:MAG: NifB/NifX family molybdenum-iron cluster-binding protein [Candidatus Nanopelagicales bacterium]
MTRTVVAATISPDGSIGGGLGKAHWMAIASVVDGAITDWRVEEVRWDELHDEGGEGSHHARIVRFMRDHQVQDVVAAHAGPPMQNTLSKLGIRLHMGAAGDARQAVLAALTR